MTAARVEVTSGAACMEARHMAEQQTPRCDCGALFCSAPISTNLPHADVFWTCHLHALSTEVEEVMGLLLGDVLVRKTLLWSSEVYIFMTAIYS